MWPVALTRLGHIKKFLLTHPVWDVTRSLEKSEDYTINFYSHIPCGMWHSYRSICHLLVQISTHTSRVGCDQYSSDLTQWRNHFYSHIPCGMWPVKRHLRCQKPKISTHTSRVGCDKLADLSEVVDKDFYSHIPCGMWRIMRENIRFSKNFYSHIPCGMWHITDFTLLLDESFLLTHPVWDVTTFDSHVESKTTISTHTSRVGCDVPARLSSTRYSHFYSHIPCGMWRRSNDTTWGKN